VHAVLGCVDALLESVSALSPQELLDAICGIEVLTRETHAAMLELVAGLDAARVRDAEQLATRPTLTGELLPARLPATTAALAAGQIGTGQLRVIIQTMAALPATVSQPDRDWAEATLAEHAQNFDPRRLGVVARRVLDQLNPDGPEPAEPQDPCPAAGELHIRDRRDGGINLEGWLDALHGAAFRGLIEQLAAPRPIAENSPDPRTAPQRNADAHVDLCDLARTNDQVSTAGGGAAARHGDSGLRDPDQGTGRGHAGLRPVP